MRYVDVILPLPLEGLFTYAVSDVLAASVQLGERLLVPLGRSKTYTALAVRLHDEKPVFDVREIISVLDKTPVVFPSQYELWQWMADYYMSPVGEIYKAALPSGLKLEEGYRPRTETYVALCPACRTERGRELVFDMLRRSPKQQKVLTTFLALSEGREEGECEVSREELMNESRCTPAVLKSLIDRQVLTTYTKEIGRLNHGGEPHPERIKPLSPAQQDAYNSILFQWLKHPVTLLHGVTSSGKTEIYIHLIQKQLDEGKQVLYLLPEIALTVQMMERLRSVFGNRLGIYHSKYSDAERVEIWQKQLSKNPYDVILGARSAVFLPFQRLGLIIVDEEHETSFKQQDPMPRYHARSAAIIMSAPSNLPQLREAMTLGERERQIIDYYKTASPVSYDLLRDYSKEHRGNQTEAESVMWCILRNKGLGEKFRRQHIIGEFIVDFVCLSKYLVIEIDGAYHFSAEQKEADELRTKILHDIGFEELRFTNEQVLADLETVLATIRKSLTKDGLKRINRKVEASPSWGRSEGAVVLLGTATPSVESYYNAMQGKYGLVELKTRYQDIELPEIEVVDVKDLHRRKMMNGLFSPRLLTAMRSALDENRQVILFQNRRGFAPMVECRDCGWVPRCKNCDVSLTMHRNLNLLTCHYCGYTYSIPATCPECGGTALRGKGYGTEKIEDQVMELFPDARVARMDLDTTRSRSAYERFISDFASGRTNVLIGTQMISKGLDFDRVAVVGILDADTMLNYPDFRAYEHAFMMMSQVAGRAGRKGQRGLVLLQTRNKDLPVIRQVVTNDWKGFYEELLEERRLFRYPPFFRLIYVFLRHRQESVVDGAAVFMGGILRQWFGERVLGPDKPAVARVKTLHIRKIVLKLENGIDQQRVRQFLRQAEHTILQDKRYAAVQIYFDVDPL